MGKVPNLAPAPRAMAGELFSTSEGQKTECLANETVLGEKVGWGELHLGGSRRRKTGKSESQSGCILTRVSERVIYSNHHSLKSTGGLPT